jgi:hypothetical protein
LTVQSDADLLRAAEAAFQRGRQSQGPAARAAYAESLAAFEEVARRGASNVELERTLGTAAFLADDLPRAIVAFHRGLRLAPNDTDLHWRLALVRDQVKHTAQAPLGRPPIDHWPPGLPRPTAAFWLVLLILTNTLAWIAITRWRMTRDISWRVMGIVCFLTTACAAATLAANHAAQIDHDRHPLVVITRAGVPLSRGNGPSYPTSSAPLPRGAEARRLFERGDWLQVQLSSGEIGWLPRSAVIVDGE